MADICLNNFQKAPLGVWGKSPFRGWGLLWIIYIFVAQNANGNRMDNLIGNAPADVPGIRLARVHVVPNVVRFGRKPNVSLMPGDAIK